MKTLLTTAALALPLLLAAPQTKAQPLMHWERVTQVPVADYYAVKSVQNRIYASTDKKVYTGTNQGQSWGESALVHQHNTTVEALYYFDDKLFAGTGNRGIFHSTDNGATWQQSAGSPTEHVSDIVKCGNDLYATTEGAGIYKLTKTTPVQWEALNNGVWFRSVSSIASTSHHIVASPSANNFVYIYDESHNEWGAESLANPNNPSININELEVTPEDKMFAGTNFGVYSSTDHGLTWEIDNNGMPNGMWVELVVKGPFVFAAVNRGNVVQLYYRQHQNPAGSVWKMLMEENGIAYDMTMDGNKLYFGTAQGLFSFDVTTISAAPGDVENHTRLMGQPYPNPAADIINIPYQLPAGAQKASLELRELSTGRLVQQVPLSTAEADAEHKISLSALPAGLYTCTLLADEKSLGTQKLAVVK